jgi:flagellar M-ring protein FliF
MDAVIRIFRDMGPLKLTLIISGVLLVVLSIILVTAKYSSQDFVPLYGNLDIKDSNKIITELESKNIPFQLRANGSEILVPHEQVLRLRMSMAQEGIPSKGSIVGYEIFDNSDALGTSNFVLNVNLLRALEGELARTIATLSNIGNARVHLVVPKRELFSRDKQKPSASIVLDVKGSIPITKGEINAIGQLVATAVPGLELSKITIVDTKGRSLKSGTNEEASLGGTVSTAEEYKVELETRTKNVIEDLLEQSLGAGHVKAQVAAEINFDRTVTNDEIYDPNGQVVRSVQEISDKESSVEKDGNQNVGVANNLPNAAQNAQGAGKQNSSTSEHSDTTTNYEISKTIRNHISETGTIKRLSIAVLVDGTYKLDEKTKKLSYIPRTTEELKKYESLAKSAAGFDAARGDKIEIVNMQFSSDSDLQEKDTTITWVKQQLPNIIHTLVIGAVVALALLLIVRPIAINAFEMTKAAKEEIVGANIGDSNIPGIDAAADKIEDSVIENSIVEARFQANMTYKSINDIFSKYPQETLYALRKWLNSNS